MPSIDEVFSGKLLKAADIKGREVSVTIDKVEVHDFDDGAKIIIHFLHKDKGMVINKTNANRIAEVTGTRNYDLWAGQPIVLTTERVEYKGELVDGLRVALQGQSAANAELQTQAAPADQDGFADNDPF